MLTTLEEFEKTLDPRVRAAAKKKAAIILAEIEAAEARDKKARPQGPSAPT